MHELSTEKSHKRVGKNTALSFGNLKKPLSIFTCLNSPEPMSGLDKKEQFAGNTILVLSRRLWIKNYANQYTKDQDDSR